MVRTGRGLLAVLALIAVSISQGMRSSGSHLYEIAVPVIAAITAVINWLVTRWRLDGSTLRIETGLLRRDSRQLPVARIQAVDVVRPFLARALGLAELRVRLAGSSHADGRLAYLPEQAALDLRARLLAAHHGLDPATPAPAERVLVTVPAGRLVGSVVLSGASLVVLLMIAEVVVALAVPAALAATGGTFAIWLVTLGPIVWRRLATQYGFTVAESPDGIRIRRGLLGTVAETVPGRARPGGADGRALAVAAVPLVPAGDRRGWLARPGPGRWEPPDAQVVASGRQPGRRRPAHAHGPRC